MPEAELLADEIVSSGLAACVQIIPHIISIYYWNGEKHKNSECLILIKTLDEKYLALERFIAERHSYDLPEIIAISSVEASDGYIRWLNETLKS